MPKYEQYSHVIEDIDRAKASKYLEKNLNNRHINARTVDRYSKQMKAGEWQVNGEPIMFSAKGNLLNGQHRLSAIVASNKIVAIPVFRGVAEDAIKTIDTGRPRSLADHLKIHGYSADSGLGLTVIAATIRIVFDFNADGLFTQRRVKITPTEAIKYLEEHPAIFDSAKFVVDHRSKSPVPISIIVALHYLLRKIDCVEADEFIEKFFTGEDQAKGSPILALRAKLDFSAKERRQGNSNRREDAGLIIKAWKAFVGGKDIAIGELQCKPTADIILQTD